MSEVNQALIEPIPPSTPHELKARVMTARAVVYGINGENPAHATPEQRALVLEWQYANEAERDAAKNGQTTILPRASQLRERNLPADGPRPTVANAGPGPVDADRISAQIDPQAHQVGREAGVALRAGAQALGEAAGNAGEAIGDAATALRNGTAAGADTANETAAHGASAAGHTAGAGFSGAWNRAKSSFNAGGVVGAVAGGVAAFVVSSIFGAGAGPIKWVLMALLMPVGLLLGAQKLDGPVNNFFSGIFGRNNRRGGDAGERVREQGTPETTRTTQPETAATLTIDPSITGPAARWTDSAEMPIYPGPSLSQEELRNVRNVSTTLPYASVNPETDEVYHGGIAASRRPDRDPRAAAQARHENLNATRLDFRNNGIAIHSADGPDFRVRGFDTGVNHTFKLGR